MLDAISTIRKKGTYFNWGHLYLGGVTPSASISGCRKLSQSSRTKAGLFGGAALWKFRDPDRSE